jgi:gamma-glutamylcyclotransferase (GGCT)/AIG2-like uncharacterized protein YtfP
MAMSPLLLDSAPGSLIAYGSLMWAEILERVIGRWVVGKPICIHGYRRCRITGATYPAIVPDSSSQVDCILYEALSARELQALDAFESDEYIRRAVSYCSRNGKEVIGQAWVYVYAGSTSALSGEWDPEHFNQNGKHEFLAEFRGFKEHS